MLRVELPDKLVSITNLLAILFTLFSLMAGVPARWLDLLAFLGTLA